MDGRGVNELEPNRIGPRVRIGFRKIQTDFFLKADLVMGDISKQSALAAINVKFID